MQQLLRHPEGVISTRVGWSGGEGDNPTEESPLSAARRGSCQPRDGGLASGTKPSKPHATYAVAMPREALILPLAFAAGVGAAELFGAANLGVAFAVGGMAFAATVLWLILR